MKNETKRDGFGGVAIRLRRKDEFDVWANIDERDLELVSSYEGYWQARWSESANTFYAQIRVGKNPSKFVQMHRLIMKVLDKSHLEVVVDHGDHNGLHNQRRNLEVVSRRINQMRRAGAQINSQSGYRGVTKLKNGRWRAATYKNRSTQTIGVFVLRREAVAAVASRVKVNEKVRRWL